VDSSEFASFQVERTGGSRLNPPLDKRDGFDQKFEPELLALAGVGYPSQWPSLPVSKTTIRRHIS